MDHLNNVKDALLDKANFPEKKARLLRRTDLLVSQVQGKNAAGGTETFSLNKLRRPISANTDAIREQIIGRMINHLKIESSIHSVKAFILVQMMTLMIFCLSSGHQKRAKVMKYIIYAIPVYPLAVVGIYMFTNGMTVENLLYAVSQPMLEYSPIGWILGVIFGIITVIMQILLFTGYCFLFRLSPVYLYLSIQNLITMRTFSDRLKVIMLSGNPSEQATWEKVSA